MSCFLSRVLSLFSRRCSLTLFAIHGHRPIGGYTLIEGLILTPCSGALGHRHPRRSLQKPRTLYTYNWENSASKRPVTRFICVTLRLMVTCFWKRSTRVDCHGHTVITPYATGWPQPIISMGWARRINLLITSTLIIEVINVKCGTTILHPLRQFSRQC